MATSGEQEARVRAESTRLLLKQIPVALIVNIANATLLALVLSRVQARDLFVFWWLALVTLSSVRLLAWWRLSRTEPLTADRLGLWRRRTVSGSVVSGTLWGVGAFVLFPEEPFHQVFVAFVIGGMAAGAAAGLSYSLPVYYGYLLPSVLPLAGRFFLEGTFVHTVMGGMVLIYALALSLFAGNQHAVLTSALTLQQDRARLSDELKSLLQNLEQRVQARTRELRLANEKLTNEIAERERAEAAERQARAEAEEANAAKSVFLAAASHDLRQPFQSLRLYLEVLKRELTAERQQDIARQLTSILDSTQELLDTLMNLSALETGMVKPAVQECALQSLIDPIAKECRIAAQKKGLQLRTRPCPGTSVSTDPVLFSRMLRNLVINAIRHTMTGEILIGCRTRRDHIRVEVWDTGLGIPEDKLAEVFGAFYRLRERQQLLDKGLGLGLWIVARTAQLLRHDVGVRSRVGRGSVFWIVVPRPGRTPTAARDDAGPGGQRALS
ncbi:histidine kinase [Sulfurifustis variabilis]|uniref:histidine kinase n=1 Tax=Sulfurifustis variabilis TaxID=1675686 RepID=A0A1B4V6M0_9GAMM|nr:MFS domain-containing histidine kinase [Sulfurifustis variabilis]BAU49196.1 histidine kinase [Sulfurifustis variabilis]